MRLRTLIGSLMSALARYKSVKLSSGLLSSVRLQLARHPDSDICVPFHASML
jgi:hypothetical protein